MTIAELQNGLAAKLTKTDLDGYSTQTWTQNQIKLTADGINGDLSRVESTVKEHSTSINDFQADSKNFKAQFTTYKDTVDRHDKDISNLQASSKSFSASFDSLNSDNKTNQHDIGQLKVSAKEFNNTLTTVQTQVKDSAVGTNLLNNTGTDYNPGIWSDSSESTHSVNDGIVTISSKGKSVVFLSQQGMPLAAGDHVVLSVDVKGTGNISSGYNNGDDYENDSPIQSVNSPDTWKRISFYRTLISVNSQKAQIFAFDPHAVSNFQLRRPKLEKGSLATDWCPSPADNATVTAVSKLSQTVDDIKFGVSKKIEQKDLNGYATQDWTNNQIKFTADGINGDLSRVESTVKEHSTSINDFQADSKNFKAQFTTYKDTVDRHDKDISNLQASSKSFSASFDSLNSDNKTNQHDIGQLKVSAKEFNNTLTTVQTQVKDSAVGTNLLNNTGTDYNPGIWSDSSESTHSVNDGIVTISSKGKSVVFLSQQGMPLAAGDHVVLSVDVKGTGNISSGYNNGDDYENDSPIQSVNSPDTWKRISFYRTLISVNSQKAQIFAFDPHAVSNFQLRRPKLEKGSIATDYSVNPEDTATVTAVSKILQTVNGFQTTVSDKVSSSQLTELSGQLTNQIKDLSSKTDSSFKQTASDINGRVKKGDVVNQFNIDAGGALLSTSGNSTKIVFSSPNIIFDSNNPVQIPNANIPGKLTGKTIESSTITATTKITGSDIEAPLVHSPSGSFKLDGNTGDIIGASIHSANNSWRIDKDGNINGVTINGSTINGATFNAGTKLNQYGNTSYPLTIYPDGSLNSTTFRTISAGTGAQRASIKDGIFSTNLRGMTSFDNGKYLAADAILQSGQLALYQGYSTSQDANFTNNSLHATGYVIVDSNNGMTLHGDNQQIIFNGTSDDVTPKGIIITPYGNINPNGTQNTWYVGNNMAMKTAQFGIDADNKVGIDLFRPTFVDEIGAMGNRLANGRLLLHAVDGDAQMYLLNDGKPAFVSPTIYNRTYSNGANMFVTSSGRVGRSTSASKYKLAISRSDDTLQADRLMTLKPASWNDKVATEKMAESLSNGEIPVEAEINLKRHYGLIAEDLRDAGLDEFLITGKDGQIEGIEYDRLWTVLIPKIKQLNNRINELERKTL
ncbi:prophage protein [Lactiplantibacillus plantarum]|nr:prophage protein [Lactiplantibacillus plantarum]